MFSHGSSRQTRSVYCCGVCSFMLLHKKRLCIISDIGGRISRGEVVATPVVPGGHSSGLKVQYTRICHQQLLTLPAVSHAASVNVANAS